jgi:DNA-binding protein H-NS
MSDKFLSSQQIETDRHLHAGDDPRRLEHFGYKVFSQADEDGIIEEIFKRIGTTNKIFVEFGVEIGEENNTRYLLEQGWTGLWIESFSYYAEEIRQRRVQEIAEGRLKFIEAKATAENINNLIESVGITDEIDLLSVDIDSNDYQVYEAISVINPRVLCIEHNPAYPPPEHYIMPYNPDYRWDYKDGSFGASIKSLEELANRKGMVLVGCGLYSPNGFYVRQDLVNSALFSPPFSCERFFNIPDIDKILGFPRDQLKLQQISLNQPQPAPQNPEILSEITSITPQSQPSLGEISLNQQLQEMQAKLGQAQENVQQFEIKLQELRERLKGLRDKYNQSEAEIAAMKTSKFWKLRTQWFKLKKFLGIAE